MRSAKPNPTARSGSSESQHPEFWHWQRGRHMRGPFSLEDMRFFRDVGWLARSDRLTTDCREFRPAGDYATIWSDEASPPSTPPEPGWYVSTGRETRGPISSPMLQVQAEHGRLDADDMIRREHSSHWRRAGDVPEFFPPGDRPQACPGCRADVHAGARTCWKCDRRIVPYDADSARTVLLCGLLGLILFPVFPLWAIAWMVARNDLAGIRDGRLDPRSEATVRLGLSLATAGAALFLVAAGCAAVWWLKASSVS